jgi:predicted ribosomally synthesized peptide with SipW-like signal peptide
VNRKMKKILMSLLTVALVSSVVVSATRAYFTDSAVSGNNTIAAGTVDVNLGGSLPFTLDKVAPGDTLTPQYIEIENAGTLDMLFKVYVDAVSNPLDGSGKRMADYIKATVTLNPSGYTPNSSLTLYGAQDNVIATDVPLSDLMTTPLTNIAAASEDPAWPLKEGYVAIYKIELSFDFNAPNTLQGDSFVGKLVVDGTQFANQNLNDVQW